MPDRELTPKELKKFIEEQCGTGNIFNALDVFQGEKTKPSLHDLCILELQAKVNSLEILIIDLWRKIKQLQRRD